VLHGMLRGALWAPYLLAPFPPPSKPPLHPPPPPPPSPLPCPLSRLQLDEATSKFPVLRSSGQELHEACSKTPIQDPHPCSSGLELRKAWVANRCRVGFLLPIKASPAFSLNVEWCKLRSL
jgi:hypothetical protein